MSTIRQILNFSLIPRKSCFACRYYREHHTVAISAECLLLGETLAISTEDTYKQLKETTQRAVCDGWKKRPSTWIIRAKCVYTNPYWKDPYIPRETQHRLRSKILAQRRNK